MVTRRYYAGLWAGLINLAACSEQSLPDSSVEPVPGISAAAAAPASKAVVAKSAPAHSETDKLMLNSAAAACKSDEFSQFFEAAVRSAAVRQRYFALPIRTAAGTRSASQYRFPIAIIDFQYVTAATAAKPSGQWEYVTLQFNYAQDERVRVDWVRIDYGPGGNDPGADDSKAMQADDKEYGPRGYLIFKPTAECWALVEDGIEK